MMICLAVLQSCHNEMDNEVDADTYTDNSSSSKRIKPVVVEVGEDEVLQDIGEVATPVVKTPVIASTVAPAVVTNPGMTPIDGAGLPLAPFPPPLFPVPVPPAGGFDERDRDCDFASSGFSVTDPALWYEIDTTSYPNAVPLSLNGNRGFDEGDITVTDTGITINRSGNYWVNMTAVISYIAPSVKDSTLTPIPAVGSQFIIPVFVARNGDFDPAGENQFGGIGVFTLNETSIEEVQANGIMVNMEKGTKLSIVATNSGTSDDTPIPLTVIDWDISLHRLCN